MGYHDGRDITMQRNTQQRRALRQAIRLADRPLSPQEILEAGRDRIPSLGIATVYRNIRSLLDEGWLQEVELPGKPNRYELAGKHHHHHFHCKTCDRVYDIDNCPGSFKDLAPQGFELEAHDLILYGTCRGCTVEA